LKNHALPVCSPSAATIHLNPTYELSISAFKEQPKLSIGIFTVISKHKDDRHDTDIFHHHQSIQGFKATKSHIIHALILINN
jgi:hypothetical protein